jgi:LacI family transcriptional regulator
VSVRIREVANRAGVSTATVSRVLSGADNVSGPLSERVWTAIRELGYRPNRVARRLRRPGRETWALIVPDLENRFFTSVSRGVELVASEHGITVFIGNSDYDTARLQRYLDTALAEQVAGVILAPSSPLDDVSAVVSAGTPLVTVDQPLRDASLTTVMTDHYTGGRLAGARLSARGHSRIGVIAGPEDNPAWNTRLEGLASSFETPDAIVAVERGDNRVAGGQRAMAALLERPGELDAVFVTNNLMTVGALREIDHRGLEVPGDLDVVGYDLQSEEWVRPLPVTSINQDPRRIGEVAARTLLRMQEGEEDAHLRHMILLQPEMEDSVATV